MANGSSSSQSNGSAEFSQPAYDKQKILLSSDPGHFSLIRALHMADFITELNGKYFSVPVGAEAFWAIVSACACGILSIFSSLRYCLDPSSRSNLWIALALLPMGFFFDALDGKVARWRKKSSMMGQELDSLADLISFGVAPAAVAFSIGIRTTVDHVLLTFFVLCGLTRLARFNVTTAVIPKDKTGKATYFEGTPIPTSLGLDALMAYWVSQDWVLESLPLGTWFTGTAYELHPIALLFVLHGCLMTSKTIHIPKP